MRWLKITAIILGILFLLLYAGTYYVKNIFIPGPFKEILITKAKEVLHRDIRIQELTFAFTRGVILKGISIQNSDDPSQPLFTVAEINIGVPPPNFLTGGTLVIPYAKMIRPEITLIRKNVNEWNFSDLLPQTTPSSPSATSVNTPSSPQSPKVILGLILISDGKINITDSVTGLKKEFRDLNISLHTNLLGHIGYEAGIRLPEENSKLKIQGSFVPANKELKAALFAEELNVGELLALTGKINNFDIIAAKMNSLDATVSYHNHEFSLDGDLDTQLDLTLLSPKNIKIKTKAKGQKIYFNKSGTTLKIRGQITASDTLVGLNGITISGVPAAQHLDLTIDIGRGMKASGDVQLNNAKVELSEKSILNGQWSAKNIHLDIDQDQINLTGAIAGKDTTALLTGSEISGNFTWDSAVLKKLNQQWTILGDLNLTQSKVKINGLVAQGDILLGKCQWIQDNQTFKFYSDYLTSPQSKILIADRSIVTGFNADQLSVNFTDDVLQIQGHVNTKNFELTGKDGLKIQGNPALQFGATYGMQLKDNPWSYNGKLTLNHETVEGLATINTLSNLTGIIEIKPDYLATDLLSFHIMDHALTVAGNIQNFTKPQANFTLTTPTIDLNDVSKLFPAVFEAHDIKISGQANQILLKFNGPLLSPLTANIKASSSLNNVEIKSPQIPTGLTHLNGTLEIQDKTLFWKDLNFQYEDISYTSSGSLQNFNEPLVTANLKSGDFDLTATAQKNDQIFTISSLKGTYHDTIVDVKGTVALTEQLPDVDLSGSVMINLIDLNLLPGMGDRMKAIHPLGDLTLTGRVTIPKLSFNQLDVDLKISSRKISLYGYQTTGLNATLQTQGDGRHDTHLTSTLYDGDLTVDGKFALTKTSSSDFDVKIMNLDLAKLKTAIPSLEQKDFSGILSTEVNASGSLYDSNSLKGEGAVEISNGRLLELNLLKGLWKYLLIKDFKSVVFTEAKSTFKIKNGRVSTDDLIIKSEPIDCNATGWIDFKSNVNLKINANVHESPIAALEGVKVAPTAILAQAQNLIELEVTGPMTSPEVKKNVTPLKAIQKTTGSILQGIGGMLEDIMDQ